MQGQQTAATGHSNTHVGPELYTMHHVILIIFLIVIVYINCLSAETRMSNVNETKLSFAESVYAKFSGACRMMHNLQFDGLAPPSEVTKTMKIVQIEGDTVRTFNVENAYESLTQSSVFDITKQTKVIIHGYKDSAQSEVPRDLANAYNDKNMFNVLMVDAEYIVDKWYLLSIHYARLVAKRLAYLLVKLENYGLNAEDIHLLGISLGAHMAGWTGKYFYKLKGKKIGRITGLDPAGPCFSLADSDQRLDINDAMYVDVVHSNRLMQGVIEPLGHADFYLNGGGPNQPGCFSSRCSHLRAAMVYTESVRTPKSFVAVKCESWKEFSENKCEHGKFTVLGYGSSTSSRGLYYLRTSHKYPYGLGMQGTKYTQTLLDNIMKSFKMQ